MSAVEKVIVGFLLAALLLLLSPVLLYLGAAMYEQATTDSGYPHSGFCPDSPNCYADEEGGLE